MKRVVALVLACLMALPAGAQEPSSAPTGRVRITGVSSYEIPGVIKLAGDRVLGKPIRITDQFVQFRREGDGRLLTVPRPGKRLTGYARMIGDGLVEFVPEGERESLLVPQDAIAKWEPPLSGTRGVKLDRVRITGVSTYEIPGVITIEGSQITGILVRNADRFVQVRSSDGRQLLTLLKAHQQLTGRARPIADGLLEFVPDGEKETLYVPLNGIAKTDVIERGHTWDTLSGVSKGARLRLALTDGGEVTGRLVEAKADAIVLQVELRTGQVTAPLGTSPGGPVTFQRSDVSSLEEVKRMPSGAKIVAWVFIGFLAFIGIAAAFLEPMD